MHTQPSDKPKFTPGPWKSLLNYPTAILPGHVIKVDDSVQRPIAIVPNPIGKKSSPVDEANAQLIAAAPALYEALKNLLTLAEDHAINIDSPIMVAARKALASATE
jgi:hypothetical protein